MERLAVRYTYTCRVCAAQHTQCYRLTVGDEVPKPSPPDGWLTIAGFYLCAAHPDVALWVDGEIFPLA